jgi:phage terminase large subunit
MIYQQTTAVKKILALKKRLKIVQGGTSASKTISILLILIDRAQSENGKVLSVVSETIPHLKRGAIRDFLNIMEGHRYFKEANWNRTDFIYTFETGSKIEFFSADNSDKVRGPRRDILFINECNNISYETYTQLAIRTNEDIYLDYNPVTEFWVHTEVIPKTEHDFIILTYKDNEGLPDTIVKEIESRKDNKMFWKVFGLGELGEAEGKIFKDWQIVDEVDHHAKLQCYGLDYGYSNDPTAIIAIYYLNGGYILDELVYQKGLSNKAISDILHNYEKATIVPDSAEPKSNDELKLYGHTVVPAEKGPDSVNNGIQLVQAQRISMTKRSVNLIKDYRNYLWQRDKDDHIINKPEHEWSHSMDAVRYGLSFLLKKPVYKTQASPLAKGYYPEINL